MRKPIYRHSASQPCRIAILDDEIGIIESVGVVLKHMGYQCTGFTDQREAIERIRAGEFDLLILDYMMESMHGNEVVAEIRKFDSDLYILLLTGHKDVAPPIETLKELDIQGYCEKSDKFDQMILLIESGIKSVTQHKMIKKYRDGFDRILKTVPKIYQLQPVDSILEEILQGIIPIADSHDAFILIDDIRSSGFVGNKSIFRGIGEYNVGIGDFAAMLDPGLMEQIGKVRTSNASSLAGSRCIYPLINEKGSLLGIMYVKGANTDEGRKLCEVYAIQAASSISNAFMHSLVHMKHEELNQAYETLHCRYLEIIDALRLAVDAKHRESLGHSDRVALIAGLIGRRMALDEESLHLLKQGAKLHDIGKIGVGDELLARRGELTPDEMGDYYAHAAKGANILSAVSMFREIVPIVRHHHECTDGTGYPDGLQGEAIPLLARIVHAADMADHWLADGSQPFEERLESLAGQIRKTSGTQLDPAVADAMLHVIAEHPDALALYS